ncbi:hypothetical protein HK104_011399, partial [Borealophlyctis nickersoniae]
KDERGETITVDLQGEEEDVEEVERYTTETLGSMVDVRRQSIPDGDLQHHLYKGDVTDILELVSEDAPPAYPESTISRVVAAGGEVAKEGIKLISNGAGYGLISNLSTPITQAVAMGNVVKSAADTIGAIAGLTHTVAVAAYKKPSKTELRDKYQTYRKEVEEAKAGRKLAELQVDLAAQQVALAVQQLEIRAAAEQRAARRAEQDLELREAKEKREAERWELKKRELEQRAREKRSGKD